MRYRMVCVAALFAMPLLMAKVALAQVEFDHDIPIAEAEQAREGMLLHAADGELDVVWIDAAGAYRYTRMNTAKGGDFGKLTTDAKAVGGGHRLLGVGRTPDGKVRIGANHHKQLAVFDRDETGTWKMTKTGMLIANYYGGIAGFDISRKTGRGGAYMVDDQQRAVITTENAKGEWASKTIDEGLDAIARGDFVFTADDKPAAVFQWLGKPTEVRVQTGDSKAIAYGATYRYFPVAIAADGKGGLHVGMAEHTGSYRYLRSENGGKKWTATQVHNSSSYGDAASTAIAASSDGRHIAALVNDRSGVQFLAYSIDAGEVWNLEPLPGSKPQQAAVTFDKLGRLFVAYFNSADKRPHVLVVNDLSKALD